MATTVRGGLTIRFLRNNDSIFLESEIVKPNGDPTSLYQGVDVQSETVVPDWTIPANQPIIKVRGRSSRGLPIALSSITWAYDGTTLVFGAADANDDGWATSTTDNRFKKKQITESNVTYECLRICGNIASASVTSNKQITFTVGVLSNSITHQITQSLDILIQNTGTTSHKLTIGATKYTLDVSNGSTVITVAAYYGVSLLSTFSAAGYNFKWYKDDVLMTAHDAGGHGNGTFAAGTNSITLDRDSIASCAMIVCKLFDGDNVVAQEGVIIRDIDDEYQVKIVPTGVASAVDENTSPQFQASLEKNGVSASAEVASWAFNIYNCLAELMRTGTGNTVTVSKADAAYTPDGSATTVYSDVELIFDATLTH